MMMPWIYLRDESYETGKQHSTSRKLRSHSGSGFSRLVLPRRFLFWLASQLINSIPPQKLTVIPGLPERGPHQTLGHTFGD
jgi:hypothetical protein